MSQAIETLNQIILYAKERGLAHIHISDDNLSGSEITIDEQQLVNFGSCSYLGLEYHQALKEGVTHALDKYGTQFSTSRTYLSLGMYNELETELRKMFGKPLIATASTTLGHLATLPVIVEDEDAIILDLQVHSSVQMACQLLKARKVPIYIIPHNSMEDLESKVKQLQNKYRKIWYMADGVYSMYGDVAPLPELVQLMDKYKSLHLYIDDAHGMGWTGENGTGYVRSQIPHHDKMVLATSLNKSFASAGGLFVFPNEEMMNKVKNCGSTLIFSGPIQPPMLGAGIASARLHQQEELNDLQNDLKDKIDYVNRRLNELNLPQYCPSPTPLFFVCVGLPRITSNIGKRMKKQGYFVNSAAFPAVPMKKSGIRFMVNSHLSYEEIEGMLTALQREYVLGLLEEGSSVQEVAKVFRLDPFEIHLPDETITANLKNDTSLKAELFHTVDEIDPAEWDYFMSEDGCHTHENVRNLQKAFSNNPAKDQNTPLYFYRVTDQDNQLVLLSFFTSAWIKDDMFSSATISEKIEAERKLNPYYLTSKQIMTGSMFSVGKSVYINEEHGDWKAGLEMLINKMQEVAEQEDATKLMIREFDSIRTAFYKDHMLELGMTEYQLPNQCVANNMEWSGQEEFLKSLGQKYRYNVRKEILAYEDKFTVRYDKPASEAEKQQCFDLYKKVFDQAYELNVFQLPYSVFEMMFNDPNYDIIRLYLKDSEVMVGVLFSYKNKENYNALVVGLDYEYVRSHNTYKQILYRSVLRARELGCKNLDLAFTAELEKKKVGAKVKEVYAFVQATEHMSHAILETIV